MKPAAFHQVAAEPPPSEPAAPPVARRAVDPKRLLTLGLIAPEHLAGFDAYLAALDRFRSRASTASAPPLGAYALAATVEAMRAEETARVQSEEAYRLVRQVPGQVEAWLDWLDQGAFVDLGVLAGAEGAERAAALVVELHVSIVTLGASATRWGDAERLPGLIAHLKRVTECVAALEAELDAVRRELCVPR